MGEEHVARILKMLEEGKISAKEAETLIAALRTEAREPTNPPGGERSREPKQEKWAESGSKSFEFRWGQRSGLPLDLSALGKQISAAVSKIDPDRILRDARVGGRRWQERMRDWARAWHEDEQGIPVNPMGLPTARRSETVALAIAPNGLIEVHNPAGSITVVGGADAGSVEVLREAWASTQTEAELRLGDLAVGLSGAPAAGADEATEASPSEVTVHVTGPEDWRDGLVNLVFRVPTGVSVRAATLFGELRVEKLSGAVEARAAGGAIALDSLGDDATAEAVSGQIKATAIAGVLRAVTKSGDIEVERLQRGGSLTSVSGDIRAHGVEGGILDVKSVSGDVSVEHVGLIAPLDVTVESVSGDAAIAHAYGNVTIKTVSGDAVGQRLAVTSLTGQAVSGDLSLALDTAFGGTLTTNTVSGDVRIAIPEGSNFRYTLVTRSGELGCEHPATDAVRSETMLSGTVGTGAGAVNAQTLSGDITITRKP